MSWSKLPQKTVFSQVTHFFWVRKFPESRNFLPQLPPKNKEIALLLATNRGCVIKHVSQKMECTVVQRVAGLEQETQAPECAAATA